jgi:ABC-type transport system involved in Fe-S cluster assembly fused permease/ATPase subunit
MKSVKERDALLKSLEECNCELTKAIENYRNIEKNEKWPNINEEEQLTSEDSAAIIKIYSDHKEALNIIRESAKKVKKSIVNFESFFKETKEKREMKKRISEMIKKHDNKMKKKTEGQDHKE